MNRLEGWESRLLCVIDDARDKPYRLGVHDCFSTACAAVKALTGADLWPQWAGRYNTRLGALKLITEYGGSFDDAASKLFGVSPVNAKLLRRGDIAKYTDKEPHLGVCIGATVALLHADGLLFPPMSACEVGWRIG